MILNDEIKNRLYEIYKKIPYYDCKHCQACEGPIFWFYPEEINIRDFLKENNMNYSTFTLEEFKKNNMLCPYSKNNRCSIYPVRPIVCRLQANIRELPCKHRKKTSKYMSNKKFLEIKKEFNKLLSDLNALGKFYGTVNFNKTTK